MRKRMRRRNRLSTNFWKTMPPAQLSLTSIPWNSIDLHSGAADPASDFGGSKPGDMCIENCGSINPSNTTAIDALALRLLDALALPLLDEAALHLSDHAKHRQHHLPHIASRGDVRVTSVIAGERKAYGRMRLTLDRSVPWSCATSPRLRSATSVSDARKAWARAIRRTRLSSR